MQSKWEKKQNNLYRNSLLRLTFIDSTFSKKWSWVKFSIDSFSISKKWSSSCKRSSESESEHFESFCRKSFIFWSSSPNSLVYLSPSDAWLFNCTNRVWLKSSMACRSLARDWSSFLKTLISPLHESMSDCCPSSCSNSFN